MTLETDRSAANPAAASGAATTPAKRVIIIGAGPAGLTAAYLLSQQNIPVTVLESDPTYVGGISKSVEYKGFHFDIGGHRFFSKSKEVEDFWTELLADDMLVRPRSSRILYRGRFFSYPLKAFEALRKLGLWESTLCMLSYFKARLSPVPNPKSFEDWVSNQFGKRLFQIFFKTYTEKVWGMSCKEISADWAAQRIKGLSLMKAVISAIVPQRKKPRGEVVKTLIDSFRYPRRGPGMMWDRCAQRVREMGNEVRMGTEVVRCRYEGVEAGWKVTIKPTAGGAEETLEGAHVISTTPVRALCHMLEPALPPEVIAAADQLRYRDFITVAVMLKDRDLFADNWIYIHDPSVQVGRVQNFKSWSPEMVPDQSLTCYGLEYFCFEHTGIWEYSDEELCRLAERELEQLGLAKKEDMMDATVVRQKKAYPVYDDAYAKHMATIRTALRERFPTLHLVGRNGMHKYNNQDHSMMTAMLCARNIVAGEELFDLWQVNEDAQYHESGEAGAESSVSGLRQVPKRLEAAATPAARE